MAARAPILILALLLCLFLSSKEADCTRVEMDESLSSSLSLSTPMCNGSIGECMGEDEFEVDSESTRRMMQSNSYITYRALRQSGRPAPSPASTGRRYVQGCVPYNRCKS